MNLSAAGSFCSTSARRFQTGQLILPLEDPEQAKGVQELKRQMARASLKVTASGKQMAVVQRSHDDLSGFGTRLGGDETAAAA